MIASSGMVIVVVIVSSSVLFCVVVDSFRFGAVWILSTRRLSVVRVVFHCCGFFPLQSRVDSFHSAAQCCPRCLAMLWILSTSEPCGFFPLGDSVVSVLFRDAVDSFHFRAVWILSTRRLIVVLLSSSLVCPTTWLIGRVSSRAEPLVSGAGTLAWYTLALLSLAWDAPSYMGRACCLPDC